MSQAARPVVPIAVAVVRRGDEWLIGTRGAEQVLALKAEFPGGKIEPGETSSAAAVRECHEESGLIVRPVRLLLEQRHVYDHAVVQLHFWLCEPVDLAASPQHGFAWLPTARLTTLDFPAANGPLLKLLT